jgi:hypothetical protein
MKLLGIISVGFDVTNQLLIKFSAFVRYWLKKWEYNETVRHLFIDFKKAYDLVRREVLHNIVIKFVVPMKLLIPHLAEMKCLHFLIESVKCFESRILSRY